MINVRIFEQGRRSVGVLSQIDRAKTIFFSKLSRKFSRTDAGHVQANAENRDEPSGEENPASNQTGTEAAAHYSALSDEQGTWHEGVQPERDSHFLSRLDQEIGSLSDPDQIIRAATRAAGEYLGAHRCYFLELDETAGLATVSQGWCRDETPSLSGAYRAEDFADMGLCQATAAGRIALEDITRDPLTSHFAPNYERLCVRSMAIAPFIREGRWTAALVSTDQCPRRWSEDALALLETTVAKVWPLIERARSEQALRKSERRLRFLSDITKILVSSLDPPSILKEIAEGSLPTLGDFCFFDVLTEDRQIYRLAWAHDDTERREWFDGMMKVTPLLDYAEHPIARVIESGEYVFEPIVTDEWKRQIATSPEHLEFMRWAGFHSLISVPVTAGGEILGAMTFCFVTPHRRHTKEDLWLAEEVGRRAAFALRHARLYQQSLEREERLRHSEQALREASRLKDEFLANLSHELRSPLNAILGYVRLLHSGMPDEQTLAHHLDVIERNARAQAQLVEDLLDTSRIVSGKFLLESRPVNLTEVIERAVDVVRPTAESKGVELRVILDHNAGQVTGDASRLQQVVWNLLSNAIKFTPKGGYIEVKLWDEGSQAFVSVRDTGQGIHPEFLPYVFDRFRQADASISRRYGGLGLGLALVRHTVKLHSGTVVVESDGPGQGALFTIRLPIRVPRSEQAAEHFPAGETRAADPMVQIGTSSLAGVRVLAVDDQEETCELLFTVLTSYGAEVITASSGAEALALLSDHSFGKPPDVFICDIGMPDQDGYTVLRQVRDLEDKRGVPPAERMPALALTAYVQASDRIRALATGFQMHLPKPIDENELAVVIASLTGRLKKEMEQ